MTAGLLVLLGASFFHHAGAQTLVDGARASHLKATYAFYVSALQQ